RLLALEPSARPAHAFEVVAALGDAVGVTLPLETPGTARCWALSSLLVGREREQRELQAALARAAAGTGARVFVVSGGPGSGKTRLVRQLARLAETGGWRVASATASGLGPTSAALVEIALRLGVAPSRVEAGGELAAEALLAA